MKLVSERRAGQKVVFPFAGEIEFDEKGVVEVDDEIGKQILEAEVADVVEFGKKTKKQEQQEDKRSEQEKQVDDAVANIKKMKSYDELHGLCKEAGIPESEWEDLKVPQLKELLISKIAPKK